MSERDWLAGWLGKEKSLEPIGKLVAALFVAHGERRAPSWSFVAGNSVAVAVAVAASWSRFGTRNGEELAGVGFEAS